MNNKLFYNKDGSLTTYSFACGHIERTSFGKDGKKLEVRPAPVVDDMVELYGENMSISLYSINVYLGGECTWLQRSGLKKARKCANAAKSILKKYLTGKLSAEEAQHQVGLLGFEDSDED